MTNFRSLKTLFSVYFVKNYKYSVIYRLSNYVQYWAFVGDGFKILFSVLNPATSKLTHTHTHTHTQIYIILFQSLILKQNGGT
jgi:hypothetical protein